MGCRWQRSAPASVPFTQAITGIGIAGPLLCSPAFPAHIRTFKPPNCALLPLRVGLITFTGTRHRNVRGSPLYIRIINICTPSGRGTRTDVPHNEPPPYQACCGSL